MNLVESKDTLNVYDASVVEALDYDLDTVVRITNAGLTGIELTTLFTTADELSSATIVEIGARQGTSSVILATVAKRHNGRLYSIECAPDAYWYHNMEQFNVSNFAEIIEATSPNINVMGLPFNQIDYLLIDADHSYDSVIADYYFWVKLVRPGGRIAFHDYYQFGGVRDAVAEISAEDPHLILIEDVSGKRIAAPTGTRVGLLVFEKMHTAYNNLED